LSAHADAGELLRWLKGFQQAPHFTFVVHGERKLRTRCAFAFRSN
jgi:hypothetical protein